MSEQKDILALAIISTFGPRCPDWDEGCPTCRAWMEYDRQVRIVTAAKDWRRARSAVVAAGPDDPAYHDKLNDLSEAEDTLSLLLYEPGAMRGMQE